MCSARARALAEKTGYYEHVYLYDDVELAKGVLSKGEKSKLVVSDFGSRGAADVWFRELQPGFERKIAHICIAAMPDPTTRGTQFSAPHVKAQAFEIDREAGYYEKVDVSWKRFLAQIDALGVRLVWKDGLEAFKNDWERIVNEPADPTEGLVYRL